MYIFFLKEGTKTATKIWLVSFVEQKNVPPPGIEPGSCG